MLPQRRDHHQGTHTAATTIASIIVMIEHDRVIGEPFGGLTDPAKRRQKRVTDGAYRRPAAEALDQ